MVLLLAGWLVACSHDVRARFPSRPDEPTGTLVLSMSEAASGVAVAVNGVLVVDDEKTDHITIEGVPTGTSEIVMTANGADKAFRVWVDSERPTTVPLGVPAESFGFLKSVAGSLISIVVYSLLR
jgi:hypothetical protein